MTPADLTAWRTRMGWLKGEAAKALGLSLNGYGAYERGYVEGEPIAGTPLLRYRKPRPIPKHVELACEALEARILLQIT
jgi:hypothetical protein